MADADHQPTAINSRIRRILGSFDQVAYVGYTATPFANIFIHPDAETGSDFQDLFPRDFIVNMPTPDNYVGASRIFGYLRDDEDGTQEADLGLPNLIIPVEDHAESLSRRETRGWMPPVHRVSHVPLVDGTGIIPDSLLTAIRCFALVVASRRERGLGGKHNSMLIHVTRFQAVQRQVVAQIQEAMDTLANAVRYGGTDDLAPFRTLWEHEFEPVTKAFDLPDCPPVAWADLQRALRATISSIAVREINGSSADVLDYDLNKDQGLNVIAVGGDKLARGLTLEGLSITYFLRGSTMYDTLMQMGRWFGYRRGYLDLCRLFTTQDHVDWYGHIAQASDELRREFDRMEAIGADPIQFGLRVRSHPSLTVTSRAENATRHRSCGCPSPETSRRRPYFLRTDVSWSRTASPWRTSSAALGPTASDMFPIPARTGQAGGRIAGRVHTCGPAFRLSTFFPSSACFRHMTTRHGPTLPSSRNTSASRSSIENWSTGPSCWSAAKVRIARPSVHGR